MAQIYSNLQDNREKVLVLDLDHTLMCNFKQGEIPAKGLYCPVTYSICSQVNFSLFFFYS